MCFYLNTIAYIWYLCSYVCICISVGIHVNKFVCFNILLNIYIYTHTFSCTSTGLYVDMCVHFNIPICICIYICIYMQSYVLYCMDRFEMWPVRYATPSFLHVYIRRQVQELLRVQHLDASRPWGMCVCVICGMCLLVHIRTRRMEEARATDKEESEIRDAHA